MNNFKWYRKLCEGTWYKYQMTGQIPCYGSFWSRKNMEDSRFCIKVKTENYGK